VRHPADKVKVAERVTEPLRQELPFLPENTETLVRINGGVQVVAGLMLARGTFRRLAAMVLAGSLVPTTIAGHPFWSELDEEQRSRQQMQFWKNSAILGGLILALADTEGAPSTSWRVRGQLRRADRALHHSKAGGTARRAMKQISESGGQALRTLDARAGQELAKGSDVASHALASGRAKGSEVASHALASGRAKGSEVASHALASGREVAGILVNRAQDYLPA
jgi:uncharacterized membrane protein YphA (DoxX/SURF4 family)